MLFRRVLSLVLAVQMLLTQGLLCRCCTAAANHEDGHGRQAPHIHTSQLSFGQAEKKPSGCPCCRRHARQVEDERNTLQATLCVGENHKDDDCDDAVYVNEVVATRAEGQRPTAADHPADALPPAALYLDSSSLKAAPTPTASPPPIGMSSCPVYLQTCCLLI